MNEDQEFQQWFTNLETIAASPLSPEDWIGYYEDGLSPRQTLLAELIEAPTEKLNS